MVDREWWLRFVMPVWATDDAGGGTADDEGEEEEEEEEEEESGTKGEKKGGDEEEEGDTKTPTAEDIARLKAALKKERAKVKRLRETKPSAADKKTSSDSSDPAKIRAEARAEAIKEANDRIRQTAVRLAAKGRMANPDLAPRLIDLDELDVDDDGFIDPDDVDDAIEKLIKENPGLAAGKGKRKKSGGGTNQDNGGTQPDMNQLLRAAVRG